MRIYLVLIFLSCAISKGFTQEKNNSEMYLIEAIEKQNSWNIIYATKQDTVFKIVTGGEKVKEDCNKVIVGKYYNFKLKSRRENVPVINGIKLKPINHLDVESNAYDKDGIECYSYDQETEICIEPERGINDIYYTEDLVGLCFYPR